MVCAKVQGFCQDMRLLRAGIIIEHFGLPLVMLSLRFCSAGHYSRPICTNSQRDRPILGIMPSVSHDPKNLMIRRYSFSFAPV